MSSAVRYGNFTMPAPTAGPTALPNLECVPDCEVHAPRLVSHYWEKISAIENITIATVLYVVNNSTNTTRTTTVSNEIPRGYTLPDTNEAGTRISTLSLSWGPNSTFTTVL